MNLRGLEEEALTRQRAIDRAKELKEVTERFQKDIESFKKFQEQEWSKR